MKCVFCGEEADERGMCEKCYGGTLKARPQKPRPSEDHVLCDWCGDWTLETTEIPGRGIRVCGKCLTCPECEKAVAPSQIAYGDGGHLYHRECLHA